MSLHLLGPVRCDGVPDGVLGSAKVRALLSLLALRVGREVPLAEIGAVLWGESLPPSHRKAIQGYVSTLRHALGADRITTTGAGYRLEGAAEDVDALVFEQSVVRGRQLLAAGDPRQASRTFLDGLALFGGQPVADLTGTPRGRAMADRLVELRLSAEDDYAEARLQLGHHGALIADLRAAVAAQPLRERRWSQLMLALYRSGRQTEALRTYQRLRGYLAETVGVEPSPELTALDAAVLAHDPTLSLDAGIGRPDVASRPFDVPLPVRLTVVPDVGVLGRRSECDAIAGIVDRVARNGRREVVLVSGEAGIGKSSLAGAGARHAWAEGCCVVFGRCHEDLDLPYGPFVEALDHLVAHLSRPVLAAHVDEFGSALDRIVPRLGRRLGPMPPALSADAETERYILFASIVALLAEVARVQPLVVVLEDLQWADRPTLQLLRHVVADAPGSPLVVVGTFRDHGDPGPNDLAETVAALCQHPGTTHLALGGLAPADVASFLAVTLARDLSASEVQLASSLFTETDGNPFFVGELIRHLVESGRLDVPADHAAARAGAVPLPRSVHQVVGARVARLGRDAGEVLQMASAAGRTFDLATLAEATGRDMGDLLAVLERAAAASLVDELADDLGSFSFTHALIQRSIYEGLGPTRRALTHLQLAEALERLVVDQSPSRAGELAFHWSQVPGPVAAERTVTYARRAGEAALSALAPDDAVRQFGMALAMVDAGAPIGPVEHLDLLLDLGAAQRQAGQAEFTETYLLAAGRARACGATDRLIRAALGNTRGIFSVGGGVDWARVEVIESALAAMAPDDTPARALLLATLSSELAFGSLDRRRSYAAEAEAMARRLGDPETLGAVLVRIDMPLQVPQALAQRLTNMDEALALAEARGDPDAIFWAAAHDHVDAGQDGDFARCGERLETMRQVSDRLRQPTMLWATAFCEAAYALVVGDAARAEQLSQAAFDLGSASGQPDAFVIYASQLTWCRFQQGRMGELVDVIAQVTADTPGAPAFRGLLALATFEAGGTGEACRLLEAEAALGFSAVPHDLLWTSGIADFAEVAIQTGAPGPAGLLYDLLDPYRTQVPFIGASALDPIAHFLGGLATVLGRFGEAERCFAQAAESNARGARVFCTARTELEWARMLVARKGPGDVARARSLLDAALATARRCGYAALEARAHRARDHVV